MELWLRAFFNLERDEDVPIKNTAFLRRRNGHQNPLIMKMDEPQGEKSKPTKGCSAAAAADDGPQSRSGLQGEAKNRHHYIYNELIVEP